MEPVPVYSAAADGCTHVLVLLTRSLPPPPPPPLPLLPPLGAGLGGSLGAGSRASAGAVVGGGTMEVARGDDVGTAAVAAGEGAATAAVGTAGPRREATAGVRSSRQQRLLSRASQFLARRGRRLSQRCITLLTEPHMRDAW